MHLDVQDLKNFYYRQSLGRAVQRVVRKEVVRHWPDTTGQTVVGFGFAVPLLRPFLAKSRRVIALMPGPQGVMHWPAGAPNVSVITDEFSWPLETGHVDRLVLFHGLENCEHPAYMLEEARRVLGPGGVCCSSCQIGLGYGRVQMRRHLGLGDPIHWGSWRRNCA